MSRKIHLVATVIGSAICASLVVAQIGAVEGDRRLVQAVKTQNTQAVPALLKASVDVNLPDADGTTALHWAAHWNDAATVDLLLRAGAKAVLDETLQAKDPAQSSPAVGAALSIALQQE